MKRTFTISFEKKKITLDLLDIFLACVPSIFFLFVTWKFWGQPPALDPMVIYRESTQFFHTGLEEISKLGYTIHPPLIYWINWFFAHITGHRPASYHAAGFIIFFLTSNSFYFFIKHVFSRKVAALSTLLLFCHPLVILNSFWLGNDVLILCGIVFSLIAYTFRKYVGFSIILGLFVLMKETALVVIGAWIVIMVSESIYRIFWRKEKIKPLIMKFSVFIFPLVAYLWWRYTLHSFGLTEWREHSLIESDDSSFVLVIKNLVTFKFLNKFFKGNLENLFVFNFQWLYAGLLLLSMLLIQFKLTLKNNRQRLVLCALGCISVLYILMVLSFPTFTVLRYGIPVLAGFFVWLAVFLDALPWKSLQNGILVMLMYVCLVSNFTSLDPVTRTIHRGTLDIYEQKFYNVSWFFNGPDRISYNVQVLEAVSLQNDLIKNFVKSRADILLTYCDELKLGEKIWSITVYNEFYPGYPVKDKQIRCINDFAVKNEVKNFKDKVVYIRDFEKNRIVRILSEHKVAYKELIVGAEY